MNIISKCANPDCLAAFDYCCGRFFRFRRRQAPGERPVNSHSVVHFWLCKSCSEIYTLEDRMDAVQISLRHSWIQRPPSQQEAVIRH